MLFMYAVTGAEWRASEAGRSELIGDAETVRMVSPLMSRRMTSR